jgi:hypothetical protein
MIPKGGETFPPFDEGGLDNFFQRAKVLRKIHIGKGLEVPLPGFDIPISGFTL